MTDQPSPDDHDDHEQPRKRRPRKIRATVVDNGWEGHLGPRTGPGLATGTPAALAAELGVVSGRKRRARVIGGDELGVRTKKRLAADIIAQAERRDR